MKKLLITLLKISVSAAIIYYLVMEAKNTENEQHENVFQQLRNQPKLWDRLAVAWFCCAGAVTLTLIRWWYLVRALDIPLRLTSALRIGFIGYLANLAPLGIVGGDVVKTLMLRHEHRKQTTNAIASVIVDRAIGLYLLFIVASGAIFASGLWSSPDGYVRKLCYTTFGLTALGAVASMVVIIPGFTEGRGTKALARLPRIGPSLEKLIEAVRIYRRKPRVLLAAGLMSVGVHSLFATGIYLISTALFQASLSLQMHFVVSPLSAATGVIPLPLGPFEYVLDFLYTRVPSAAPIPTGQGLVVALGYRLICVLIATIGVVYYFSSRKEVAQVMHEAEQEQEGIDNATIEPDVSPAEMQANG